LGGGNRPFQPLGEDPNDGYVDDNHEKSSPRILHRNSRLMEKTESYICSEIAEEDIHNLQKRQSIHNTILHEMGDIVHQQSSKHEEYLNSQSSIERSNEIKPLVPPRRRFGLTLFNNILQKRVANTLQSTLNKTGWKFYIFELGKKLYHIFENKLLADYNIPIVPEDETIIV
jgi:hypothetical protein